MLFLEKVVDWSILIYWLKTIGTVTAKLIFVIRKWQLGHFYEYEIIFSN